MADADEPAHFISGLMVRDYLASGFSTPPLEFAREYYAHYPKIAIGNWPPLFYAVEGTWLLLLPTSPDSVLILMALISAALGWLVFRLLRPVVGGAYAILGAGLLILLQPVPLLSSMVMLELPLALASLVAVACWARFMDRTGLREALTFGAASAIAVLTKWNALFLVLVPPLAILIGRRWTLLRSRGLWIAAGTVGLLGAAAAWLSLERLRTGWDDAAPSAGFTLEALEVYGRFAVDSLGLAGVSLFLTGLIGIFRQGTAGSGAASAIWSSAAALIVAVTLLQVLVPAGINPRYLVPALPGVAMLMAGGAWTVGSWLGSRGLGRRSAEVLVISGFAALFVVESLRLHRIAVSGYGEAAAALVGEDEPVTALILSDAIGEGVFISEVAIRDVARPCHTVWRGTNLLALSTWAGREYRLRAADDRAVLDLLEQASIEYVLVDRGFGDTPHQRQLEAVMSAQPARFALLDELPVSRRHGDFPRGLALYRFLTSSAEPPSIRQVPGYDGVEGVAGLAAGSEAGCR